MHDRKYEELAPEGTDGAPKAPVLRSANPHHICKFMLDIPRDLRRCIFCYEAHPDDKWKFA